MPPRRWNTESGSYRGDKVWRPLSPSHIIILMGGNQAWQQQKNCLRELARPALRRQDAGRKRRYLSFTANTKKEAEYQALQYQLHYKEVNRDPTSMTLMRP